MFMEKLLSETRRLSVICSMLDTMRQADGNPDARGWTSPVGLLKITASCAAIAELAAAIARAGYRECDKATLEEITGEMRHVLYALNAPAAA
ncbi:hypothetical protein [Rhizobium binxianense]